MKIVKLGLRVVASNASLAFRKCTGCSIKAKAVSLISPLSSIRTIDGGFVIIGKKTEIRPNVELTARKGSISIGDGCFVNRNCLIVSHEAITIEDNVTIGPCTMVYDHDHSRKAKGEYITAPIVIKAGAWIGANVTILKGVTIGEDAVISAGCVITKDVPANVTVIQKRSTEMIDNRSLNGGEN